MCKNRSKRISHELQFNVAQLLKQTTGATRSYDIYIEGIDDFDDDVKVVAPVTGHVDFLRTGTNILVTGRLQTTVQKSCARCLTTFTAPLAIELEEEFHPTVDILSGATLPKEDDVDEINYIDELHILDLSEVVQQEIFLEGDSMLYCRPDCKGLCPHCGQDRNVESCDCTENIIDPRWTDLLQIQSED